MRMAPRIHQDDDGRVEPQSSLVMETDHDVAVLDKPFRSGIILSDLFRLVVRGAIDINRCICLPKKEVRLREVAGDPVLGIAGQP